LEVTLTKTEHMNIDNSEQFIGLFGIREENIPLFKDELGVEIFAHGDDVTQIGRAFTSWGATCASCSTSCSACAGVMITLASDTRKRRNGNSARIPE
jgi:phosphate starvation-inducible protein PhoH